MEKKEIDLANRIFQDATVGMLAIDKILKTPAQNSITNLDFGMLSDFLSDRFLTSFNMKETKEWISEEFRVEFQKLQEMIENTKNNKVVQSSEIIDELTSFQKLQLLKNFYSDKNVIFGVTEFRDLLADAE